MWVFTALLIAESSGCNKNPTPPAHPSPVLTLSAVQPSSGPAGVATSINITGAAFQPETILTIGGVVTKGTFFNSSFMTASAPAHEAGAVDVVVTNPDGMLTSASVFVAADTPLGPAYLAYGRTRDNQSTWYFYLGRPF